MFRRFLVMMVSLFLCSGIQVASAWSPKPRSFEILADDSMAMVYGQVTKTSNNGRQPTLEVIQYAGPGKAPKNIHLPSTESSLKENDECPDFSMKFQEGKEYIVFLKGIGAAPEYLHANWTTALTVEGPNAIINMRGEKESAAAVMQKYAAEKQQSVTTPDKLAQEWGNDRNGAETVVIISLLVLVIAGGVYLAARRKR